jgi:hypothetical protein
MASSLEVRDGGASSAFDSEPIPLLNVLVISVKGGLLVFARLLLLGWSFVSVLMLRDVTMCLCTGILETAECQHEIRKHELNAEKLGPARLRNTGGGKSGGRENAARAVARSSSRASNSDNLD